MEGDCGDEAEEWVAEAYTEVAPKTGIKSKCRLLQLSAKTSPIVELVADKHKSSLGAKAATPAKATSAETGAEEWVAEAFAEVAPKTAGKSKHRSLMRGKDAAAEAGASAASAEGRCSEARRLLH